MCGVESLFGQKCQGMLLAVLLQMSLEKVTFKLEENEVGKRQIGEGILQKY